MLDRSTRELLPWLIPINDGVVICKDSGLLASFQFEGIDADAATSQDVEHMLAKVDMAMGYFLNKPVSMWWTVRRTRTSLYPDGEFPDPVGQMLSDEHKQGFLGGRNFVNRHYISILLLPERGANRFFDRVRTLIGEGESPLAAAVMAGKTLFNDRYTFAWQATEMESVLTQFEDLIGAFTSTLGDLHFRRLRGPEFLGFLREGVVPGVLAPVSWDGQLYLDEALPELPISVGDNVLQLGDVSPTYASAVSMKAWPDKTWSGAMDLILSLDGEMTMSHVFRVAPKNETKKHIEQVKRFNELLKYPLKSYIVGAFRNGEMNQGSLNESRAIAADEAKAALSLVDANEMYWGWHNATVITYGTTPDAAREAARTVRSGLQNASLPGAIMETQHLLSAWATTLPGGWEECRRWSFLSVQNATDNAPTRSVMSGEPQNKYLTEQRKRPSPALTVLSTDYRTPFYFNFHWGALAHALVVGPSRSGKSVFMNFLLSMWRKYEPSRVIIFDKDRSCMISTLLQGGQHINLTADGADIKLNPMAMVENKDHWPFLSKWLEGLLSSRGYTVTADDERAIWEALEEIAEDPDPGNRRLMTVYSLLPPHLKTQLEPWVGNRPLARYFDNVEDSFSLSDLCCIEMGEVLSDARLARAFMDYAFYRIKRLLEENRKNDEVTPTIIYLEECWFLLEDETFGPRVRDWLKTFAKLTANVVMATQSLEDIVNSGSTIFSSIRDNVPTRIFLPNRFAGTEDLKAIYRKQFDLTEDQVELIRKARPMQDYFIVKPGVSRMTQCPFNKRQLAVLRSDALAQSCFERHYRGGHGAPGWQQHYIEEISNG